MQEFSDDLCMFADAGISDLFMITVYTLYIN